METLKQLFGCCIPGRRDQRSGSQGQDESTPLLNDGRSRAAGAAAGTGASPHASQEGIADDSSPTGSPPSEPEAPAYTPRDLAVITGWAREQFLRVNDPRALEGKRRSIIESVDSAEGKEIEQNAKVQSLVENLAKGIAFNGWAQQDQTAGGAANAPAATPPPANPAALEE